MEPETDELKAKLERYPAVRYPVQHATAQFHLGTALLQASQTEPAVAALSTAEQIFGELGMRLEHAKATMMNGAARRAAGEPAVAAEKFAAAAEAFAAAEQPSEEAAAHFNLGLVRAETGDLASAAEAFEIAETRFHAVGRPVWAAAAAREHGTALFNSGEAAGAIGLLETSIELARDVDPPGSGAAANVLGLAQLALGQPAAAVEAFRIALAWHPRSVRPAEHAMVKANLALAHEAAGAPAHARLTAGHALSIPQAPQDVRQVATGVLDRLPPAGDSDLFEVLAQEPVQRWEIWVRDEMLGWSEADQETRDAEAARWVRAQVARGAEGVEQAQILLGVLLELPPSAYALIIASLVEATADTDTESADRFQSVMRSAMARYPMPQWNRMAASFTAAAERAGHVQQWS